MFMCRIVGIVTMAALLGACSKEEKPEKIRPVLTQLVELQERDNTLVFPGVARSTVESNISFRVGGLVEKFPIQVGDHLKAGQLLAALQDTDFQLELDQATASLEENRAAARNALAQYKRVKALYESESASRNELDSARADHEGTRAAVRSAESAVELAQQQLSYTKIHADVDDCYISAVHTEVFENVTAGQAIATVTCGKNLEVEVAMPEVYIANLERGEKATIYFSALPNSAFQGTVTKVGVAAVGGTTFPVTVELDESSDALRSGMAATVYFDEYMAGEADILVVPLTAVGNDKDGAFVYLYEPSDDLGHGIAKRRQIGVGRLHPVGMEITEGLKPGEMLITAGVRFLYDGRAVKLLKD